MDDGHLCELRVGLNGVNRVLLKGISVRQQNNEIDGWI
jgi:hypothetical protein